MWLVNRKSSVPAGKCRKLTSSASIDVAAGLTPDDGDVCEVEWDSPKPLSGNVCSSKNM